VIYLDDNLLQHPKILRAAAKLGGQNGGACAVAMYLEGLAYTRHHLTDGFVPTLAIKTSSLVREPLHVATALVAVKLWHRVPNGFRIHDYHDWNKSAAEVKRERRKWRAKKQRQRSSSNGRFSETSRGVSPGDPYRDSRARTRSHNHNHNHNHDHNPRTSTNQPRSQDPGDLYRQCTNRRSRGGMLALVNRKKTPPTHRVLCAMLAAELADDPSIANALEGVKVRLVRQGYAYPANDHLDRAVQSLERVRRKVSA
jgi:hypothetical protein